jgi:hypothetical protein
MGITDLSLNQRLFETFHHLYQFLTTNLTQIGSNLDGVRDDLLGQFAVSEIWDLQIPMGQDGFIITTPSTEVSGPARSAPFPLMNVQRDESLSCLPGEPLMEIPQQIVSLVHKAMARIELPLRREGHIRPSHPTPVNLQLSCPFEETEDPDKSKNREKSRLCLNSLDISFFKVSVPLLETINGLWG